MAGQGTVTVKILGDAANLKSALREADTYVGQFSDKMKSVGSKIAGVGATMTAGITLPLAAIGGAAFEMASDLNESLSKATVVFGDFSDGIVELGDRAAQTLGMSKQAAIEAAATFGNLFRAMGMGKAEAANMSGAIVELAADLASFNNLDPAEVLEKLRSGLVGEAEPLRTLGVQINEAAVQAKAMQLGLVGANGELSEGAKIQARYALILEQTKTAQGDFARTADGAANKQRILKAEFEDTAAVLGQKLMPIGMKLLELAAKLATAFTNLSPHMQDVVLIAAAMAAAIGPLTTVVGGLVTAIGALLSPIAAAVAAGAALIALAVYAYYRFEAWRNIVNKLAEIAVSFADKLRTVLAPMINYIADHSEELSTILAALGVVVGVTLVAFLGSLAVTITSVVLALTALGVAVAAVIDAVEWLWARTKGLRDFLGGAFTDALAAVSQAFAVVRDVVQAVWDKTEPLRALLAGGLFIAIGMVYGAVKLLGDIFMWLKDNVIGPVVDAVQHVIDLATAAIGLVGQLAGVTGLGGSVGVGAAGSAAGGALVDGGGGSDNPNVGRPGPQARFGPQQVFYITTPDPVQAAHEVAQHQRAQQFMRN